jgi:glycosyltransferase involved in cell wall biosynthesis|tara:strand:+ start:2667 stop:3569 length:903 start_codon:yes stop_codon:yes gene_type:complete
VNDLPLISIIINCFNGDRFLQKALDSVISQTYKNWEIIFWDNQSTDKSAEIFNSYKDVRFKYYKALKHSEILYEAKNYALEKANGEFYAFLDVDDWWLPNKLEKQVPLFKDPKVGIVYGNFWNFFEKKNKTKIFRKNILPTGMILKDLLSNYSVGSPTYMIRKKSLDSLKFHFNNNYHIIGEFDLITRLSVKWKADCVQSPVAHARRHEKSESYLKRNLEIEEMKVLYTEMKNNPEFSYLKELEQLKRKYMYLQAMEIILNKSLTRGFSEVMKYPLCFKKFKLALAMLMPKFLLKIIKTY